MSALSKIAIAALGVLAYKNRDKIGGMLGDLLDSFKKAGQGDAADSWVGTGPNKTIAPEHVEKAISPEVLDQLAQQTGMSRAEILERLSKDIPDAVNEMTPDGKLPPEPAGKGPWAA